MGLAPLQVQPGKPYANFVYSAAPRLASVALKCTAPAACAM
jgi:hypothetical protein